MKKIEVYELLSELLSDMQISIAVSLESGESLDYAIDRAFDAAETDLNTKMIEWQKEQDARSS